MNNIFHLCLLHTTSSKSYHFMAWRLLLIHFMSLCIGRTCTSGKPRGIRLVQLHHIVSDDMCHTMNECEIKGNRRRGGRMKTGCWRLEMGKQGRRRRRLAEPHGGSSPQALVNFALMMAAYFPCAVTIISLTRTAYSLCLTLQRFLLCICFSAALKGLSGFSSTSVSMWSVWVWRTHLHRHGSPLTSASSHLTFH